MRYWPGILLLKTIGSGLLQSSFDRQAVLALIALPFLALVLSVGPSRASDLPPPGETFRDCPACPLLVTIPTGSFVMGSDGGSKYEQPSRPIEITRPYAMGVYEVTFEEWDACVADGGCAESPSDHGWGKGRNPIINVNIEMIEGYLAWISAKTGFTYRLPSEVEWEYAAKAGTTTEYWWGDEPGKGHANCRKCGTEWSGYGSAPVGSFEPNPFGLYDTSGNAWEWAADCWHENHVGAASTPAVRPGGDCKQRVIRGGSWYYFPKLSRSSYRYRNAENIWSYNISFRVLRESIDSTSQ